MYISLFGELFTWFWGRCDGMMLSLVAFVVVDTLTSMLRIMVVRSAKKNYKLWVAKRITLFLIVGIGNITDCYLTNEGNAFRAISILFYIGCEGATILKNAKELHLPLPQRLSKFLMELCEDGEPR